MRILPVGDHAVTVDFGNVILPEINQKVTRLAEELGKTGQPGIQEMVPTYRSLLVCFDPRQISRDRLSQVIRETAGRESVGETRKKRRIHVIPCTYGGSFGEDLQEMENLTGLSVEEIIQIHSGRDYLIYMMGFLPGFVYLGGMDQRIACPRLGSPRVSIPAGSVGIGGSQTGIYPIASPGGWRLIGKTPVRLFDPTSRNPILCTAGEYIRFVPMIPEDFERIRQDLEAGTYYPEVIEET